MKISLGTHIINVDSSCPPLAVMKAKHILRNLLTETLSPMIYGHA